MPDKLATPADLHALPGLFQMLYSLILAPFLSALLIMALPALPRRSVAMLASLGPLLALGSLAWSTPALIQTEVLRSSVTWIPELGLNLDLRLDGLAWLFAGLVSGIGLLIVLYAHYYLSAKDSAPRFFATLLVFMGSMLGMVTAGNLLLLVVFWELTSISSFLLIGFWHQRADARQGARMALTITGSGGLALLAAALLIGEVVGSYDLDAVLSAGDLLRTHALYPWILGLVLLGAFTKSAQFPFHFWLPHAMAAPTPVSAYLHSATMVKMGVFLLARLHPALADTELWFYAVSSVGMMTLLIGAWVAIFQHDLKGLMAYSTISHLGLITLLFGLPTPLAVVAGLLHLINHACFKASLFMAAGIIDHETGTRDLRRLHRLARFMPVTSTLAIVAAMAMAGIPFLNGFLSKEMFFNEALQIEGHGLFGLAIALAAVLSGMFGVAYSLRFVHDCFFSGDPALMQRIPHEPPRFMRVPVEVLVLLCLAVGIAPAWVVSPALEIAVRGALYGKVPDYHLAIWHGFNLPLLMSGIALLGGVAIYFSLRRLRDMHRDLRASFGRSAYGWILKQILRVAGLLTRLLENGSLQRYLLLVVASALALAVLPFAAQFDLPNPTHTQTLPVLGYVLWLMLTLSTLALLRHYRQRLHALLLVGGIGLVVSVSFVFLSAPDLALTQLLVETASLLLLLLVLNYLPEQGAPERPVPRRLRDALIAIACGGGVGVLVYHIFTRPLQTVAPLMLERSLPEGGGSNVVNVILVDIRGFDTLGEITVFGIAGLIVHALLRRAWMRPDQELSGSAERLSLPTLSSRLLLPMALTVALYLFLRGHNLPGGGFIAGLVVAAPLVLQYLLGGFADTAERIGFDMPRVIALGLLLAAVTGLGAWLWELPLLTSWHGHLHLPWLGELPLASAMGFDTGVLLVVLASSLLMLLSIGSARRAPRGDHS